MAACTRSSLPLLTLVKTGNEAAAAAEGGMRRLACHSGQQTEHYHMRSVTCCALGLLDWIKGDELVWLLEVGGAAGHKSERYAS